MNSDVEGREMVRVSWESHQDVLSALHAPRSYVASPTGLLLLGHLLLVSFLLVEALACYSVGSLAGEGERLLTDIY